MSHIVVALLLVQFTGPAGNRLDINADAVTSIRDPHGLAEGHIAKGTKCVVVMNNGKFIAVADTCDVVRMKLRPELPTRSERGPCTMVCGDATR